MISFKKGYKKNRPRQGESLRLQILQWNAGGMSPDKKIQIQKILQTYDVDIFTIMEANISDDKLKHYQFPGYTLYHLPKYRQVASGILTGVKEGSQGKLRLQVGKYGFWQIYSVMQLRCKRSVEKKPLHKVWLGFQSANLRNGCMNENLTVTSKSNLLQTGPSQGVVTSCTRSMFSSMTAELKKRAHWQIEAINVNCHADQWLEVFTDEAYIGNQANLGANASSQLLAFFAAARH
ncbi:unnamed protein product [Rodentolepis nana]|uniref:Endo/exonuclease/phosphatase domain-containing protein n=1 Tax=Rodentolepis nana TaxID=102285 RepID=A0A0R3T7E0_RODNA|nr:unnamed protein product [Rodentolepis nana]